MWLMVSRTNWIVLQLAVMRLEGATQIADDDKRAEYLRDSREKIELAYSEFKVCAGLRETRDRLQRLLDPLKAAIERANREKVEYLLYELEKSERLIIDELGELWPRLNRSAALGRIQLRRFVADEVLAIGGRQERVKRLAREIHDSM